MTDEARPTTLREELEQLARIVEDIAKMTPKLKSIGNLMLFEAMKKSLEEMTAEQTRLVEAIVARSQDPEARQRFEQVKTHLEGLEVRVMASQDMDEIKALGNEMEGVTDQYSSAFQSLVRSIVEAQKSAI
ncbi:MAG TPA: hypothetical protein VGO93_27580 [Candidatus Xenobia bacterium]